MKTGTSSVIKKKGLVVSRQVGAARAFAAWVSESDTINKFELEVLCYEPSASVLRGKIIDKFQEPDGVYDFFLSGTSLCAAEDALFFEWAKKKSIPSFAFVDQWINYRQRFEENQLPDNILLVDERAHEDIVRELNPACRLIVAGTPALSYLKDFWNLYKRSSEPELIYFATEPVTEEYQKVHGLNDLDQLQFLIGALGDQQNRLRVLPHPSESGTSARLQKYKKFIVTESKEHVFCNASLITGMRSMILLESLMLGIPTLSLQIGRLTPSSLTDGRAGLRVATIPQQIDLNISFANPDYTLSENSWTENILKFI